MGVSRRAYARHRGCSDGAVRKAIASGRIAPEPDGTIDPAKADAEWERNTRPGQQRGRRAAPAPDAKQSQPGSQAGRSESGPARSRVPDYGEQRAIREAYAARLAKLDYEERTGKLVGSEQVKVGWFNVLRILRDRLLNLPDRLAAVLAAEADPGEVRNVLMAELRTVLTEIADSIDGLKRGR